MNFEDIKDLHDFWSWAETHKPYSITAKQLQFARHLFSGKSQVESARLAGYQGENLAVTASRTKRAKPVKAILADAATFLDEGKSDHVLPDELLKVLSNEVRHGDSSQSRIRAAEVLSRHYAATGKPGDGSMDMSETLTQMCKSGDVMHGPPFLTAACCVEAAFNGLKWQPPTKQLQHLMNYPELVAMVKAYGGNRCLPDPPTGGEEKRIGAHAGAGGNGAWAGA